MNRIRDTVTAAAPVRPARYAINAALFFAALVVSCVVADRWLPYPDIPGISEKVEHLAIHGDDYDVLFIGSSRINFQIMPSLFDREVAARGGACTSFNAGIMGMRPPEEPFFLDQVLRLPHRRLRWVIIELSSLEARTPASRRSNARFVSWHDAPRMRLLEIWTAAECQTLLNSGAGGTSAVSRWWQLWDPISVFLLHVPAFCERTLNLGRATFLREHVLIPERTRRHALGKSPVLGKAHDGWAPYLVNPVMGKKERANYRQTYEGRLESPALEFQDPASDAAVQAMAAAVTRAGATPVFLIPPMTTERQYCPHPAADEPMIIWRFSDPRRYPTLFAIENRHDSLHLNTSGAREFSLALAARFVEELGQTPPPTPP